MSTVRNGAQSYVDEERSLPTLEYLPLGLFTIILLMIGIVPWFSKIYLLVKILASTFAGVMMLVIAGGRMADWMGAVFYFYPNKTPSVYLERQRGEDLGILYLYGGGIFRKLFWRCRAKFINTGKPRNWRITKVRAPLGSVRGRKAFLSSLEVWIADTSTGPGIIGPLPIDEAIEIAATCPDLLEYRNRRLRERTALILAVNHLAATAVSRVSPLGVRIAEHALSMCADLVPGDVEENRRDAKQILRRIIRDLDAQPETETVASIPVT